MKTIWKYEISMESPDHFSFQMPMGAKILAVQVQIHLAIPVIWAIVTPDNKTEERVFTIRGTGHAHSDADTEKLEYIGTFQLYEGHFVGHLFEVLK